MSSCDLAILIVRDLHGQGKEMYHDSQNNWTGRESIQLLPWFKQLAYLTCKHSQTRILLDMPERALLLYLRFTNLIGQNKHEKVSRDFKNLSEPCAGQIFIRYNDTLRVSQTQQTLCRKDRSGHRKYVA